MLGTSLDRSGANASAIVIGILGEHLFSARQDLAVETNFSAAWRCI